MSYQALWQRLVKVYAEGEAKAIARMVYEVRYGLSLADLLMGRDSDIPADELEALARRLEQQEPVQYVLGQAEFCRRTFIVTPAVLIPRPETEELCRWIVQEGRAPKAEDGTYTILDIGTGSGCIAITLAAELPQAQVTAWDISAEALAIARENAIRNNVNVTFTLQDVLNTPRSALLSPPSSLDIIVSNPPYIINKERERMDANVLEHEPHTALFVPDDDPLLFYRAIAEYGQKTLKVGGWLYFEINPLYTEQLHELFSMTSYHDIEIKEDQYGKQRMLRARL